MVLPLKNEDSNFKIVHVPVYLFIPVKIYIFIYYLCKNIIESFRKPPYKISSFTISHGFLLKKYSIDKKILIEKKEIGVKQHFSVRENSLFSFLI